MFLFMSLLVNSGCTSMVFGLERLLHWISGVFLVFYLFIGHESYLRHIMSTIWHVKVAGTYSKSAILFHVETATDVSH